MQAGKQLDASTTQPEHLWYRAADDWEYLSSYCFRFDGPRYLDCVDIYSVSQKFAKTFAKAGFSSVSYDIKSNPFHDVTSKVGFLSLLNFGLALLALAGIYRILMNFK